MSCETDELPVLNLSGFPLHAEPEDTGPLPMVADRVEVPPPTLSFLPADPPPADPAGTLADAANRLVADNASLARRCAELAGEKEALRRELHDTRAALDATTSHLTADYRAKAADQAEALAHAVTARARLEAENARLRDELAAAGNADPTAADTPLCRAARVAVLAHFGSDADVAAWLRANGWLRDLNGWKRGPTGGVHDVSEAVRVQGREDAARVRHLVGTVAPTVASEG